MARTIRSILSCDDPVAPADIVVMACNCTDRTTAIAKDLGCTVFERIDPARRGKGYGLDHAFRRLEGSGYSAYLIVDADTVVSRNFLTAFRQLFARGADGGQCILAVANPTVNARTRLMNISFLSMTFLRPLARQRLGLSVGLHGNGFGLSAADGCAHAQARNPHRPSFSAIGRKNRHRRLQPHPHPRPLRPRGVTGETSRSAQNLGRVEGIPLYLRRSRLRGRNQPNVILVVIEVKVVEAIRAAVADQIEIMVDANQAGVEPGLSGHVKWVSACSRRCARAREAECPVARGAVAASQLRRPGTAAGPPEQHQDCRRRGQSWPSRVQVAH